MRIQNNIMALTAHRFYTLNNLRLARSIERLSSGYRINRAGDDPAGLAISEKMRAQIRGMAMAVKNSHDAISMVQTAEGAMQESHNILQRMRELALQSASDTNELVDRNALQQEYEQLLKELNDIAGMTRFNDMNLLDGSFQQNKSHTDLAGSTIDLQKLSVSVTRAVPDVYTIGISYIAAKAANTVPGVGVAAEMSGALPAGGAISDISLSREDGVATDVHNGNVYTLRVEGENLANMTFTLVDSNGETVSTARNVNAANWSNPGTSDATQGVFFEGVGTFKFTIAAGAQFQDAAQLKSYGGTQFEMGVGANEGKSPVTTPGSPAMVALTAGGETVYVKKGDTMAHFASTGITLCFTKGALRDADLADLTAFAQATGLEQGSSDKLSVGNVSGKPMVIQTGANQGDTLSININAMDTGSLGVKYTSIGTREDAQKAITAVNKAINQVSSQRASMGAMQNRLEFKISYLETFIENLTAAESRIRDVDIAKEMAEFTKYSLLAQMSTAMLAQANAIPQLVLQLLLP